MKKRLLITSIVMMLVIAVALSTATYAWFTSNNAVTASTVTMTAHVADASSISIGWVGGSASGQLAAVDGNQLYPICPIALTGTNAAAYDESTNSTGLRFNRAEVSTAGVFEDLAVTNLDPYTFISSSGDGNKTAFFINNDSPSQAVNISATASIKDVTSLKLGSDTVLAAGKTYYTWAETSSGSGVYTATPISTSSYTPGTTTVGTANLGDIYDRKPVANSVRVAIYATAAQNTTNETVATANYTFKGLLGSGDGSTPDTAMGPIVKGTNKSSVADKFNSASSVSVISGLAGNKAVYLIVKVWIDGDDFTQEEGAAQATVDLTFTATK